MKTLFKEFEIDEYFDGAKLVDGKWIDPQSSENNNVICRNGLKVLSTLTMTDNGEPEIATYEFIDESGRVFNCNYDNPKGVAELWAKNK